MDNNCLVVYASCGEGHKKAGEALACHFNFPLLDFLDFSPFLIRKLYSAGYSFIVKNIPFLWFLAFELTRIKIFKLLINYIHLFLFSKFFSFLREKKPSCIIVTHFFPIYLVKKIKREFNIKLIVAVTDLGIHPLWIDSSVDQYLVALKATKEELISGGVDNNKVKVTGLPLRQGFREKIDTNKIRKKFFEDSKPIILILSSTQGNIRFLDKIVNELVSNFNLIIIYGKNNRAKVFLDKTDNQSIKALSYYENMWELMEIASFIITKPGGLTVFESLCKRKYMIFTHFIWGQEKYNMDTVTRLGLGFYVSNFRELKSIIYAHKDKQNLYRDFEFESSDIFSAIKDIVGNSA